MGDYLKGRCDLCSGKIEFPAYAVGQRIECPHCRQTTVLMRTQDVADPAVTTTSMAPAPVKAGRERGGHRVRLTVAIAVAALAVLGGGFALHLLRSPSRETVLDGKVHLEFDIVQVPRIPPLCDSLRLDKRRIAVDDCQLYCETAGNGPALVLINGGPGGTHHDFHPYFEQATGFATVVYYDQRGCGQSAYVPGSGYTVEQAVDDLDKLRVALKVDRWVVLGWSYGGVLAQCYTVKHAESVAGLVLVASATDAMRLAVRSSRQSDVLSPEERKRIGDIQGNQGLPLEQRVFNAHLNGDWKRQNFYRPTSDELARMALYGWKHDPVFRGNIGRSLSRVDLRGLFEGCPIPIILTEGRHDLTWAEDKPEKLQACFPGSRLVKFDRSAHAPFADEPDKFFSVLRNFVSGLPQRSPDLVGWKERMAAQQAQKERSPEYVLQSAGWGRKSSEKIAAGYSGAWSGQVGEPLLLLKLGFALYDCRRYADALVVFQAMEKARGGGAALVWQGHMLDLLGRREEALVVYKKALATSPSMRHDQYGIVLSQQYVQTRLQSPFARVENRQED